jgi:acyl dehydratase
MARTTVDGIEGVQSLVGQHLGYSDWVTITQEQVNQFADATGDHQWIHIDEERAKAGPFKTTIAHGYLTVSLLPMLVSQVYRVQGARMGVNYGLDKLRFPAPVPVGSKIRAGVEMLSVDDVAGGALQVKNRVTIEREGGEKPCAVAETLSRVYF